MPTLSGRAGRAEAAEDLEDLGQRVRLEREPDDGTAARSWPGRPGARARSRRTGPGRRRTAASRARGRAPRRPRPTIRSRPSASMSRPGRTHQGRSGHACGRSWTWVSPSGVRYAPGAWRPLDRALPRRRRRASPRAGRSRRRSRRSRRRTPRRCGRDGFAIAADLADVLAGGGLQFARRRRLVGATQGLDASAHARTVRPPGYPRPRGRRDLGDAIPERGGRRG